MKEPIQELAPRLSDCLKVIYTMQEGGQKVSTSAVSEHLSAARYVCALARNWSNQSICWGQN